MITRRQAIVSTLFGTGLVGLRALSTGLPTSFLLNPRRALADNAMPACTARDKAQFIIFNTSGGGDPSTPTCPARTRTPTSRTARILRWPRRRSCCQGKCTLQRRRGARSPQACSIAPLSGI